MTMAELYQAAKLRVRKSISDGLDQDLERIAQASIEDLKRIGVDSAWLDEPSDPLIVETILSYVKANYSIDTDAYPVLSGIYDMNITKVKGSAKYFATPEALPGQQDPEPEPGTEVQDG